MAMSAVASVSTSGVFETASPRALAAFDVDVVEADAEVRQRSSRAERLGAEHLGGELVGHGGQERVGGPQRVLQPSGAERPVVAVEPGVEVALQLLLHRRGQPAGHHHDWARLTSRRPRGACLLWAERLRPPSRPARPGSAPPSARPSA